MGRKSGAPPGLRQSGCSGADPGGEGGGLTSQAQSSQGSEPSDWAGLLAGGRAHWLTSGRCGVCPSRAPVLITSPPPFWSESRSAGLAHKGGHRSRSEIAEKHLVPRVGSRGPHHAPPGCPSPSPGRWVRCECAYTLFVYPVPLFLTLPVPPSLGRRSPSGPSAVGTHPGSKNPVCTSTLDGGADRAWQD